MEALRILFFFEKRAFYNLNERLVPLRATKFAKLASCKIRYLELFNKMMEGRNGGLVEWRNILRRGMTETKVSKIEL